MLPDITNDPEVREVAEEAHMLATVAARYSVGTAEEYTVAGDELKRIKAAQRKLDELRKKITRPMDAAKKAVLDLFRDPEDKLRQAEAGMKRAMIAYSDEQEQIRREEQRRAEDAARKEREKLEAQAARAANAGKDARAEVLEQRAAAVVAPIIQREALKVSGVNTREVWQFAVTDDSLIPREFLAVDTVKIGKVVRALKGDTAIPGVRVWAEKQIAAGAA